LHCDGYHHFEQIFERSLDIEAAVCRCTVFPGAHFRGGNLCVLLEGSRSVDMLNIPISINRLKIEPIYFNLFICSPPLEP
jgi:hypothetical protein